jgi:hypothetical protein
MALYHWGKAGGSPWPIRRPLVHATLAPGASLTLDWQPDYNALVYVMAGRGSVGADRRRSDIVYKQDRFAGPNLHTQSA